MLVLLFIAGLLWVPLSVAFMLYSLFFPIVSMVKFYAVEVNSNGDSDVAPLPVLLTIAYFWCVISLVLVGVFFPVGKVRLLTLELADLKGFPSQFYSEVVVKEIKARFALRRLRASLYKTLWISLGKHNAKSVWDYVSKYSAEALVDPS